MRRLFRLAHAIDISPLLNVKIHDEIVLDPEAPRGIQRDTSISLEGISKREIRVGLGLPGWGEGFQYPRCIVSEFEAALSAINPTLIPNKNDIFIGFLDPISYYKLASDTNTFFLAPHVSSNPQSVTAFPGLKLLLVGDTHHGLLSLQNAIAYCQREAWDAVLLCHQPSHLDWFRAILGEDRVFHYHQHFSSQLLGLTDARLTPPAEREFQELIFHGDFSHLHPRRSAVHFKLLNVRPEGIYRNIGKLPLQDWMQMLPREAAVVTGCLNNQISTYQLYTMLNGCLLFSDRFHTANGLGKLFKDGESYVLYETAEELIELYYYYQNNPECAAKIARRGRELVDTYFTLSTDSHPWLLAETPEQLRTELRASTNFLECQDRDPVRWTSITQLAEDLAIYQILHDTCTYYSSIRWITGDRDSASLMQAVLQQIPRCLVSQMFLENRCHEASPVIMTRIPSDRELMTLADVQAACLLVLFRPDECSPDSLTRLDLENRLKSERNLNWQWLGSQVHRNNMAILIKARLTPNACWPLPPGWHGLLIWDVEAPGRITTIY
jgi:hypothetical protein